MKYRKLGRTDLRVSNYCLGSMTWGEASSEKEGHWQLDTAVAHGINFVDTAEMYPTNPLSRETAGKTEEIIGSWLKSRGDRNNIIIASKIAGEGCKTVRNGDPITGSSIELALDDSLARLQTDYIDLYQLHWPNRGSDHFRKHWSYRPQNHNVTETYDNILDVLKTLSKLIKKGKIRAIGLSNESCWGTMKFLDIAKDYNLARVATVQNEYSLLCRLYDTDMAEMSTHEDVHLLAYSPLAAGFLTGKYQDEKIPTGSRLNTSPGLNGRINCRSKKAVAGYLAIAKKYNLSPIHMALAFCAEKSFMGSVIFGATRRSQLETILESLNHEIPEECLTEIEIFHKSYPLPM